MNTRLPHGWNHTGTGRKEKTNTPTIGQCEVARVSPFLNDLGSFPDAFTSVIFAGMTWKLLLLDQWKTHSAEHVDSIRRWTVPFRERRRLGDSHPVHDFLFVYYRYSSMKLEQWHPGTGILLQGATKDQFPQPCYRIEKEAILCDPQTISEKERNRLLWTAQLLRRTQSNRANYSCLGLHEWAMVYRGEEVRHEKTTRMRLPQNEIDALVESRPLTCSHFDAFRFFAKDAKPLNRVLPTLNDRPEFEQPACIHANMDLYKWAFKSMPWIGSNLLRRCFELAMLARAVDMRASPYDLSEYEEYTPIKIETADGRAEYEREQRTISDLASPLRNELASKIEQILCESNQNSI